MEGWIAHDFTDNLFDGGIFPGIIIRCAIVVADFLSARADDKCGRWLGRVLIEPCCLSAGCRGGFSRVD